MLIVIGIILLLILLYLFSLRGRTGHPGLGELRRWRYAHRGLHREGVPENRVPLLRKGIGGIPHPQSQSKVSLAVSHQPLFPGGGSPPAAAG